MAEYYSRIIALLVKHNRLKSAVDADSIRTRQINEKELAATIAANMSWIRSADNVAKLRRARLSNAFRWKSVILGLLVLVFNVLAGWCAEGPSSLLWRLIPGAVQMLLGFIALLTNEDPVRASVWKVATLLGTVQMGIFAQRRQSAPGEVFNSLSFELTGYGVAGFTICSGIALYFYGCSLTPTASQLKTIAVADAQAIFDRSGVDE